MQDVDAEEAEEIGTAESVSFTSKMLMRKTFFLNNLNTTWIEMGIRIGKHFSRHTYLCNKHQQVEIPDIELFIEVVHNILEDKFGFTDTSLMSIDMITSNLSVEISYLNIDGGVYKISNSSDPNHSILITTEILIDVYNMNNILIAAQRQLSIENIENDFTQIIQRTSGWAAECRTVKMNDLIADLIQQNENKVSKLNVELMIDLAANFPGFLRRQMVRALGYFALGDIYGF